MAVAAVAVTVVMDAMLGVGIPEPLSFVGLRNEDGMGGGRIPYEVFPTAAVSKLDVARAGGGPGGGGGAVGGGRICLLRPDRTPRALPPLPDLLAPAKSPMPTPMIDPLAPISEAGMGGGAR